MFLLSYTRTVPIYISAKRNPVTEAGSEGGDDNGNGNGNGNGPSESAPALGGPIARGDV